MNLKLKNALWLAVLLSAALDVSAQQKEYSWANLPTAARPVFKADTFNIVKYGARPDGISLNTPSINDAINACSASGGGVVLVPAGFWITGPIVLKSNVNLHIDRAAVLQFTADKSQYPLVKGDYEGHPSPRNQSPISGTNLENIAITGEGIIDGSGAVWRSIAKEYLTSKEWNSLVASGGILSADGKKWYPSESFAKGQANSDAIYLKPGQSLDEFTPMKDFFRPNLVVLNNCKRILLAETTFENSPAWCLHMLLCQDLTLYKTHVRNPWNAENGDGIDVESCRNVVIEGSTFECGDDGICVKSGRDEDGRKRGKPTENMVVHNDIVYRAHGGFVIGSEMSGGARNIFVSDCTFIGTDNGLRFKTTRGRGGIVENIYVKNITMEAIRNDAILFDMYYANKSVNAEVQPVSEATPQFRNFYVSNIVCDGAAHGLLIRGLPEMAIEGIHLDNIVLRTTEGALISEAKDITLNHVTFECTETSPVIEVENSSNVSFGGLKYSNDAEELFGIKGKRSQDISVKNTDVSAAKKQVSFSSGADEKAITITK